jgi:carboxymethylenebutenolidase
MRNLTLTLLSLFCFASFASAAIPPTGDDAAKAIEKSPRHGEYVDVPLGDAKIKSWVVYPERKEKAPVVIVIHEIFGLTDWIRAVADSLAAEGFIAVAPDLLSGKGPSGGGTESFAGDKVRDAIRALSTDEVTARLNVVRDYALALPAASGKSATIGFCWGGAASFTYATNQPKLDAAAVYYGASPSEGLEKINAPIAGFYGSDDVRVNPTIEPAKKKMDELKKSYEPHLYDGAGHGFLRQQTGREANNKAAEQAWPATIEFFKKHLE